MSQVSKQTIARVSVACTRNSSHRPGVEKGGVVLLSWEQILVVYSVVHIEFIFLHMVMI